MNKNFLYTYICRPKTETDSIIMQIQNVSEQLSIAYSRFNYETNEDLIESVIYEIQSLKAQYRYLMKIAKETGRECNEIRLIERGMTE